MHVFSKPVGREFAAYATFPGPAIDNRACGGELVPKPEIIEKTGDVLLPLPAPYVARNQVGQRGKCEIGVVRPGQRLPSAAMTCSGRSVLSSTIGRLSRA